MTGYQSKKAAARDKLVDDRRAYYEKFDDLYAVYLNGVYDGKKAAARDKINGTKPMKIEVIKDYALPCMNAEHALKEAHQCMLSNHYDDAIYECTVALTYIANMMEAIKHMKEQDK